MKLFVIYILILICFLLTSCKSQNHTHHNELESKNNQALSTHDIYHTITNNTPINNNEVIDKSLEPLVEPSDDILVKIRLNSENQNIYIYNKKKHSVDCNNDNKYEFQDVYQDVTCSYKNSEIVTIKITITKEDIIEKDRFAVWDDNRTNDLISITNNPFFRNRTMRVSLNTDETSLAKNNEEFEKIIPFKATYITLKDDVIVDIPVKNLPIQTALYEVDCNDDGIYENKYYGTDATCHFSTQGKHQIAIRGKIPIFQPYDNKNYYLKTIEQWGTTQWLSMHRAFSQCGEFNITAKDAPDLSHVTDMSEMFARAEKMNANINHWDVSNVKDMKRMFYMAKSFNQPLDKWDTSNVVNMTSMFAHARKFNQNINSWNVSHVKNMSGMFYKAKKFNKPLDKWDVSHVEYMPDMFAYTFYNKPLRNWNLASLKDARGMFEHSSSDKYTDAPPILFFKDKVFQEKVCQRIESIGRKCYLLYNEAADPWRDRDDYPDDPAYQKDDNDYERIF